MPVADGSQFLHEFRRRGQVAAFPLKSFDNDGGTLLGWNLGAENPLFNVLCAGACVLAGVGAFGTAVQVRIWNVYDARNERRKTATLLGLGTCERERTHGASMERAVKGDNPLALGVIARKFERSLNGLCAGVAVIHFVWPLHGSDLRETLSKRDHVLVIEIRAGHVDKFASLLLDGGERLPDGSGRWRSRRCRPKNRGTRFHQRLRR